MLLIGSLMVAGPFVSFHAAFLGCVGILMIFFPPAYSLPRCWWLLAGVFVIAGSASFLPVSWFAQPSWRTKLEGLGLVTGDQVCIQVQQAVEAFTLFIVMLFTGMWLVGHRVSGQQQRFWALCFSIGVAIYAIASLYLQNIKGEGAVYGFFPNRNHTATFLSMGAMCGLGCLLQAQREKRYVSMSLALVSVLVCFWAVGAWSISRSGILLVSVGSFVWLCLLGKKYLSRNSIKALALLGLTIAGIFLLTDGNVKQRVIATAEKAQELHSGENKGELPDNAINSNLDFRYPIALETLELIRDFKWTGVGAGQFRYVFPQYRDQTIVAHNAACEHPESDWLWMASEVGVIATSALAILVILAFTKARKMIAHGRDRAIRSACLVAAMLVPLHGIFDVPGHRIVIAWSAAFLFCLALSSSSDKAVGKYLSRVPTLLFRCGGFVVLCLSAYLVFTEIKGGPVLAITAADSVKKVALQLWEKDQALQKAAWKEGKSHNPPKEEDLLEKTVQLIDETRRIAPMDVSLMRTQLYTAIYLDDRETWIDELSALELEMDPKWIEAPFYMAKMWTPHDSTRALRYVDETRRRAKYLDQITGSKGISLKRINDRLRIMSIGHPELQQTIKATE